MGKLRLLTRLQIINVFGINEAKYGKDVKKRRRTRLLLGVYAFVGVIVMVYAGALAGLYAMNDMSDIIPAYAMVVVSLVVIFMTIAKAGDGIFNMKTYERLAVLPVKSVEIVVSRFLAMYVINLLLGLLVILPCAGVYAVFVNPDAAFYIMMLLSVALIPFLAMTIATVLGALVVAVSSRIRHKSAVSIALMLVITLAAMALPMTAMSGTEADFARMAGSLVDKLCAAYPPARLFSNAVLGGDWGKMAIFAALSVGVFTAFIYFVQMKFLSICSLLNSSRAGGGYVVKTLESGSALKALYKRELKRYVASSIYVMNTSIGEIMVLIASVALLIVGTGTIDGALGKPGFFIRALPYAVSFMYVLSPTTTSAISLEGKQWWIIRTAPVETRTVINVKLAVNLTIALPVWFISSVLMLIAAAPTFAEAMVVLLVPLAYIALSTVVGLWINLKMPIFDWESETSVVKQSGAVGFGMLIGIASLVPPAACSLLAPEGLSVLISLIAVALLFAAAALLYRNISRVNLSRIG